MNFHLAEALYRAGNATGALERYYAAVESDHEYIESWMQLACIHAELDQLDFAKEAFEIALKLHPEYPDAHFHLAGVLTRSGDHVMAATHWTAYLEHDTRGPWAEIARQHLDATGAPRSELIRPPL
jgi:Tfp pilus assembly protein PilF